MKQFECTTPPGSTLEEKVQEMSLTIPTFANACGLPINIVTGIIANTVEISRLIATSLERGTKIPANFWLNRQRIYNESRHHDN